MRDKNNGDLEALRRSEEQLRLITENTSDNISLTTFDLKAVYVYINPSVKSLLGYDPEDMIGRSFFDFVHPDDKMVLFPLLKKYIKLKTKKILFKKEIRVSETIEFRFKNKSGNWRFMQSTVNIIGDQLLAVTRDITNQKKTEEDLKSSEERLKIIFEFAPDAIYLNDLKGNFLDGNRTAEELLGYKKEELIGRNFLNLKILSVKDLPTAIKNLAKNVLGKRTGPDEFLMNRKDGSQISVEVSNFPVKIDNKIVILGIARDISERKKSEEALSESEEKYRLLATNTLDIIWTTDIDFNIKFVNSAIYNLLGYTPDEFADLNPSVFTMPEGLNTIQAAAEKSISKFNAEESSQEKFEVKQIRKDGTVIDVEITSNLLQDSEGQIIGFQGRSVDITERKIAEEALKESEDKFRNYVETSQDLIWECDAEGRFIYLNPAWEEVTGYKLSEMFGKPFTDFTLKEEVETNREEFSKHLEGGFVKGYPSTYISKKGSNINLIFNAIPLYDKDKNIIGTQGSAYDITERKKAEETLVESEVRFKELFNNMSNGVCIYEVVDGGKDFIFKGINKSGEQIANVKRSKILGKSIYEVRPNIEKFGLVDVFRRVWKTGKPEIHSEKFYEDEELNGYFKNYVYRLDSGEVIAIFEDQTEMRKAEEELSKERILFKAIIDNIPVMLTRYNPKADMLYLNKEFEKIIGWKTEEVQNMDMMEKVYPDPDYRKQALEYMEKASNEWQEFQVQSKSGKTINSEWSNIRLDDGTQIGIGIDINERKRAEEEILKLKDGLEVQVEEKTKELKEKIGDLQRFFDATVERELRMEELFNENEKLKAELKKKG